MLHQVYAYLDVPGSIVRIMLFDFPSAFNIINSPILRNNLMGMSIAPSLTFWIMDNLKSRLQYVMGRYVPGTVECCTGVLQGTVFAPFLFTLYTSDFRNNSESCHIQKYSDDTAGVVCVSGMREGENRDVVETFTDWRKHHQD